MRMNLCYALMALLGLAPFMGVNAQYDLTIEQSTPAAAPGTVYRFYVEANDASDKISAVFGNDQMPLVISTPDGIFNSALNSAWNASGINSALFGFFPDLQDDSFATIGLDGPAAMVPGAEDPSLVQDASLPTTVSGYFQAGGTELNVNTLTGASWYVLNTAANALPTDGRWLVAQITTAGDLSGTLNAQIFPLGVGADQIQQSWDFAGGEVIIPCDGELDECGVCNGPGIAEGTCDCAGTLPAFARDCDGNCILDADGDGICDDVDGCVPDAALTEEPYKLTVEEYNVGALGTTYRFYVNAEDASDKISAVFGNDQMPLVINTPDGIYNDAFNTSWNASGINSALFGFFPDLEYDSYATIGLEGPAAGVAGAEDPSLVQDSELATTVSSYFQVGGSELNVNTLTGASWYVLNTAANALPTDGRWLVAQITTTGAISGTINYQVFPMGVGADQMQFARDFDGAGEFPAFVEVCGCMDDLACNYNAEATNEDGSCAYAEANLDCDGNCLNDADGDGVCDELEVVGCQDESACNYDMDATDAGDCDYAAEHYDCDGNCLNDMDGDGVCDELEVLGCMDANACNYNELATDDDGSCAALDCEGVCGGTTAIDGCGVCGGDGSTCTGCMDEAASNFDPANIFEDNGQCLYATTFQVDMSCAYNAGAMNSGATEGSFGTVFITGPFTGWCGNCFPLSDEDGDDVWTGTFDFPAGDVEYKYIVDDWADQENLIDDMQNGAECAPVTDYAGYANRLLAAGSTSNDTYGSCTNCSGQIVYGCMDASANNYDPLAEQDNGSCLYDVTFSVNVNAESFESVSMAGTFNGWNNGSNFMDDSDGDGIYSITVQLTAGPQEYKFLGNADWGLSEQFDGSESCTTAPGEYVNRVVEVTGHMTVDTVCYNQCEDCVYGCMDEAACNYNADAVIDDASCEYITEGCTECIDGVVTLVDADGDGVCDGEEIAGCQDESACNYNPDATDAAISGLNISLTAGFYASEISWTLNGEEFGAPFEGFFALEEGSILIEGADSYGDGWNGAVMTITDPNSGESTEFAVSGSAGSIEVAVAAAGCVFSDEANCLFCNENGGVTLFDADGDGVCDGDEVEGCQDDMACNYMAEATDPAPAAGLSIALTAGSYPGEISWTLNGETYGAPFEGFIALDGGSYVIEGFDSWGDGWNGAEMTIMDGDNVSTFSVSGSEGSIEVMVSASELACYYAPEFYECDGETCINDADGDGVCDELEILGSPVPTACNYVEGVTDLQPAVIPLAGCEVCNTTGADAVAAIVAGLDVTDDVDTDGDGVRDCEEIFGCQEAGACNYAAEATEEDGSCEYETCLGCTDVLACNYTLGSLIDDGSCDYCSCALDGDGGQNGFGLAVEEHAVDGIAGMTTYRLYVTTPSPTDFVSAVAGDELNPSYLRTSTSFYQDENGGLTAGAINPLLFDFFPSSAYDSWLTIGIDQAPAAGDDSVQDVTLATAEGDTWAADFEAGGNLELNSFFGGSWFTTNLVSNGVAGDDNRVLIAQLTTDGTLTGQLYVQVFPNGVGADAEYLTLSFGAPSCGCTDDSLAFDGVSYAACNYNPDASYDDGSCTYSEVENLDCDGACFNDADGDGVCDEDEVVGCQDGSLDALGGYNACNYDPAATDAGECIYVEAQYCPLDGQSYVFTNCEGVIFPEFDADMNGVVDCFDQGGCMNPLACNYEADLTFDDGSCELIDENMNGICDLLEGCLYEDACNYNAEVIAFAAAQGQEVFDNESCDFSCLTAGCSDEAAINYDVYADGSDNSGCLFIGCQDETALNFDASANYPGECVYLDPCPGDFTGDGDVDVNDLLDFFQLWGNVCPWVIEYNDAQEEAEEEEPEVLSSVVGECSLFANGPNATWTHVITLTTPNDANSGAAQTLSINVTALPEGGANYRVAKTVANGNWFNGNPQPLSLGENTITVNGVSFNRSVKIQFNSGDIEFDALSVNGEAQECE